MKCLSCDNNSEHKDICEDCMSNFTKLTLAEIAKLWGTADRETRALLGQYLCKYAKERKDGKTKTNSNS